MHIFGKEAIKQTLQNLKSTQRHFECYGELRQGKCRIWLTHQQRIKDMLKYLADSPKLLFKQNLEKLSNVILKFNQIPMNCTSTQKFEYIGVQLVRGFSRNELDYDQSILNEFVQNVTFKIPALILSISLSVNQPIR